jgi:hypothetical protein
MDGRVRLPSGCGTKIYERCFGQESVRITLLGSDGGIGLVLLNADGELLAMRSSVVD